MSKIIISEIKNDDVSHILNIMNDKDTLKYNFNIPVQREGKLWSHQQKIEFINSVFTGKTGLPVVFNNKTDIGERRCIDGKQRLEAVHEFSKNEIYVNFQEDYSDWGVDDEINYYYDQIPEDVEDKNICKLLPKKAKTDFLNQNIYLLVYKDLSYADERDMFGRINNGVPLKGGEKILYNFETEEDTINYTKFCKDMRQYIDKFVNGHARKGDILLITRLVYLCSLAKISDPSSDKIKIFISNKLSKNPKILLNSARNAIKKIFGESLMGNSLFSSKTINCMIYVIFYQIYKKYNKDWASLNGKEILRVRATIVKLTNIKNKKKISKLNLSTQDNLEKICQVYDEIYDDFKNNNNTKSLSDNDKASNSSESEDDNSSDESDDSSEEEEKPAPKQSQSKEKSKVTSKSKAVKSKTPISTADYEGNVSDIESIDQAEMDKIAVSKKKSKDDKTKKHSSSSKK
jgi:hypothetical protein